MNELKQIILAAVLVAAAIPLSADIIWSGEKGINLSWLAPGDTFPMPGNLYLDLNNDGKDDFQIGDHIDDLHPSWFYAKCYEDSSHTGSWIGEAGNIIGDSAGWVSGEHLLVSWMVLLDEQELGGVGAWLGKTGHMGVKFEADDGTHFGWVQMTVYDEFPGMTIHSWAYETTPDVGIVAGAVPEPSSVFLVFLGAFTLWGLKFRKDRRVADKNE